MAMRIPMGMMGMVGMMGSMGAGRLIGRFCY